MHATIIYVTIAYVTIVYFTKYNAYLNWLKPLIKSNINKL